VFECGTGRSCVAVASLSDLPSFLPAACSGFPCFFYHLLPFLKSVDVIDSVLLLHFLFVLFFLVWRLCDCLFLSLGVEDFPS